MCISVTSLPCVYRGQNKVLGTTVAVAFCFKTSLYILNIYRKPLHSVNLYKIVIAVAHDKI